MRSSPKSSVRAYSLPPIPKGRTTVKKTRTLLTIPIVGLLVLAGVFSNAPPALANCPPPPGMTSPAGPSVTAQQVENGSANLREFALAAKDRYLVLHGEASHRYDLPLNQQTRLSEEF